MTTNKPNCIRSHLISQQQVSDQATRDARQRTNPNREAAGRTPAFRDRRNASGDGDRPSGWKAGPTTRPVQTEASTRRGGSSRGPMTGLLGRGIGEDRKNDDQTQFRPFRNPFRSNRLASMEPVVAGDEQTQFSAARMSSSHPWSTGWSMHSQGPAAQGAAERREHCVNQPSGVSMSDCRRLARSGEYL